MSIFRLESAVTGYRGVDVLGGVSLEVGHGEFIALIGPNGAGKSTLLRLMRGYLLARRGTVFYRGRDLGSYQKKDLAREISVVHQFAEEVPPFRVREYVAMGRFPHQRLWAPESLTDRARIDEALAAADIAHLSDRPLTMLSGGELQRAHVARAFAQASGVMLLDEPVSHLDITHAVRIMDMLYRLHRQGTAIVTVLHDINLAAEYCTRLVALKEGKIFFDGAPAEVMTYQNIESLFDTVCVVTENPISGKPLTYPVPEFVRERK